MFRRKTQSNLTSLPAGTFTKTEKGYFYIHSPGKRYRIISKRILNSWSPPRVVLTNEENLKSYRVVAKMKFRNGTLLRSFMGGKVYLIENGYRRLITNPDVLDGLCAKRSDALEVSAAELNLHELGNPLGGEK